LAVWHQYVENFKNNASTQKINYIKQAKNVEHNNHYNLLYYPSKFKNRVVTLIIPSILNSPEILFINDPNFASCANNYSDLYLIEWLLINDATFSLNDYVLIVDSVIKSLHQRLKEPINLVGHCLGGTLAIAASVMNDVAINKIMLLTTPWNFSNFTPYVIWAKSYNLLEKLQSLDAVPSIVFQMFFFFLSHQSLMHKLKKYPQISGDIQQNIFWSIDYWQFSGLTLPEATFAQLINDFIINSTPLKSLWLINDYKISPRDLYKHTLLVFALEDKIVPPSLAKDLVEQLPNNQAVFFNKGHLSFLIGKERFEFFKLLANWYIN